MPSIFILRRRGALLDSVPDGVPVAAGASADSNLLLNAPAMLAKLTTFARGSTAVVGAMELEPTYLAYLCGELLRKPALGCLQISPRAYLARLSPIHTALSRFCYPRLDRVVCCSEAVAKSLTEVVEIHPGRLTTIHNYIDPATVKGMANGPLPDWAVSIFEKRTILAVGRLAAQKGFDILLRAFVRLRAGELDCNLLIMGEGPLRGELERSATSLGVADSVFMPGLVANPFPIMQRAAVFALSSRFEGFPLVLLESLLLGVPIVATDCPDGPAEVLENGGCGLMVQPEDPAALANAIAKLIRGPALSEPLKSRGRIRVEQFTTEKIVPQWEALLAEISTGTISHAHR